MSEAEVPGNSPAPEIASDSEGNNPQSNISVSEKVDKAKLTQFVTTIKNAEQQVGSHIIAALEHDDTVAVLTTVMMGPNGEQQVISAALNPTRMKQVQEILQSASTEREPEEPCVGFHCLVKSKPATKN